MAARLSPAVLVVFLTTLVSLDRKSALYLARAGQDSSKPSLSQTEETKGHEIGSPNPLLPTDDVVASVSGENIAAAQLEAATKNQLEPLKLQMQRIRQTGLMKLIDNLILEQTANSEGITIEEYLRRNVERVKVSEEEVEETYQQNKNQFSGFLVPEAKYRIRRSMEDTRRADALRQVLEGLRKKVQIRNYLLEKLVAGIDLKANKGPSLGNSEAPVVLTVFSDFECPYCRKDQPLLKRAMERWPDKVRLVLKHFPLEGHQNAFPAAVASVCAEAQGRFWNFHDLAFHEGQDLSQSGLLAVASSLGLDMEGFYKCRASAQAKQTVQEDISLGWAVGVDGTPTYFVNKRRIEGGWELEKAIEETLSQIERPNKGGDVKPVKGKTTPDDGCRARTKPE